MRLYRYLSEDLVEDYIDIIKSQCGPYLRLMKKHNLPTPFFRGILRSEAKQMFFQKQVRGGRQAKGTDDDAFEEINEYLDEMGHVRRDKCAIATSNLSWTKIFGIPHMFFPVGKFKYSFIELKDFNALKNSDKVSKNTQRFIRGTLKHPSDAEIDESLEEMGKLIHTNKGVRVAYDNNYEIWFDCDIYYVLNADVDENGVDPQDFTMRLMK